MAFDIWTPPKPPHIGSGFEINQRVLMSEFGDGYTQFAADGLNATHDTVTLTWQNLSPTDYAAIAAFWRLKGMATPFQYELPWEEAPKLWRFSAPLTVNVSAQIYYTVTAALKQAFDLG